VVIGNVLPTCHAPPFKLYVTGLKVLVLTAVIVTLGTQPVLVRVMVGFAFINVIVDVTEHPAFVTVQL
jgi:hypothetical protein